MYTSGASYVTNEDIAKLCSMFPNTVNFSMFASAFIAGTTTATISRQLGYQFAITLGITASASTAGMWLGLQTIFYLLKSDLALQPL